MSQTEQKDILDFDPNKPDKKNHVWATYCPYRSPQFKTHTQRKYAVSAIVNQHRGSIWKHEEGKWVCVGKIYGADKLDKEYCQKIGCGNKIKTYKGRYGWDSDKIYYDGFAKLVWVGDTLEQQFWCKDHKGW